MLWVPVEKLFMTEIGFDAASIGVMAAAYAALVPDHRDPVRGSRRPVEPARRPRDRGGGAGLTSLIGGLSYNVPTYIGCAGAGRLLRDVLRHDGRHRLRHRARRDRRQRPVRASASVGCGPSRAPRWSPARWPEAGSLSSPRPGSPTSSPCRSPSRRWLVLLRFREPQLHKEAEMLSLRAHLATTYRACPDTGGWCRSSCWPR